MRGMGGRRGAHYPFVEFTKKVFAKYRGGWPTPLKMAKTSPGEKWASVAIRIFYKYGWGVGGRDTILVEYFYGDGSPLFLR